eukprot:scaffold19493_cov36-Phaeocystis_antarctica.AAC.1
MAARGGHCSGRLKIDWRVASLEGAVVRRGAGGLANLVADHSQRQQLKLAHAQPGDHLDVLHEHVVDADREDAVTQQHRALRPALLQREPSLGWVGLVYEHDRDLLGHRLLRLPDAIAAGEVTLG